MHPSSRELQRQRHQGCKTLERSERLREDRSGRLISLWALGWVKTPRTRQRAYLFRLGSLSKVAQQGLIANGEGRRGCGETDKTASPA
jgi:hypothetical protein